MNMVPCSRDENLDSWAWKIHFICLEEVNYGREERDNTEGGKPSVQQVR